MDHIYTYIIGLGVGITVVAGFALQIKAVREFGILKSWLIPFEEILFCIRHWSAARPTAKILFLGVILIGIGFLLMAVSH